MLDKGGKETSLPFHWHLLIWEKDFPLTPGYSLGIQGEQGE